MRDVMSPSKAPNADSALQADQQNSALSVQMV